jgi:hypothetical protein
LVTAQQTQIWTGLTSQLPKLIRIGQHGMRLPLELLSCQINSTPIAVNLGQDFSILIGDIEIDLIAIA